MLITTSPVKGEKAYLICYAYMTDKDSKKRHDFLIIHAFDNETAKIKFYHSLIKIYWMIQIIAIKLMSEVIHSTDFFKIMKKKE